MSIARILIGVIVGSCILAGLLVAAMRYPALAMFVMFGTAGSAILLMAHHGLRTGSIRARRSRYERGANPVGYWFYISFYTLIGIVVFGYAVYCLVHPEFGRK